MTARGSFEDPEPLGDTLSGPPVLSIGVPAYRRPQLLERALRSVVDGRNAESAARVELLVSDNSPDVTQSVVEPLLARWPGPTRYIANRPDIGAVPNFNQCIERATGRFFLLLHDDDFLLPGGVDRVVRNLAAWPSDDATPTLFGVQVVDIDGRLRRHQGVREEVRLTPARALRRVLSDSSFVRIPAIVVRRDELMAIGGFDPTVGNPTDFDLLIRLFARHGVRCVPETSAAYTIHPDAATSAMFHAGMIDTLARIFDRAAGMGVLPPAVVRRCEADWFHQFILAGTYRPLRAGDTRQARAVFDLMRVDTVRALGPSRRWLPVRFLFAVVLRIPAPITRPVMRAVGRLSPERVWMPL
jgi:glycosyltransferase involved in cell wall biosynthesis